MYSAAMTRDRLAVARSLVISTGGRPKYHVWGSLSPGHGEHGSASVCGLSNRVCGQSPAGSRGRAPSQGVMGAKPPEAENLLASGCATEAANLPHSVRT